MRVRVCENCNHGEVDEHMWTSCKINKSTECFSKNEPIFWESKNDNINRPSHYVSHPSGIECIDITKHHDFCIGNAIKYLWRQGLKEGNSDIQDLKKCIWYVNQKIKDLGGAE